jgi:hypothetical protein
VQKMEKHDNFLADIKVAKKPRVSYVDGFRFGFGFFLAGLFLALILGLLTWGAILLLHMH